MIYTFVGMVFFILIEIFSKNKSIPDILMWIPTIWSEILTNFRYRYRIEELEKANREEKRTTISLDSLESQTVSDEKAKMLDQEKRQTKDLERNISILNFFFFTILLVFVIFSNILIWLLIIY